MAGGSQIKIKGGIASKGEAVVEDGALLVTGITIPPAVPTTLQEAYDASASPEIVLDAVRGALTLQDNAAPLGANLFEVEDNAGGQILSSSLSLPVSTRVLSDTGQHQITLTAKPVLSTARPWTGINFLAPIDVGGTTTFDSAHIKSGFAAGTGFDKAFLTMGNATGIGTWGDVLTIRASRVGINTGGGDFQPAGNLVVRDLPGGVGNILSVENNTPADVFSVNADELRFGVVGNREFLFNHDPTSTGGISFLPDGRTKTVLPTHFFALQWSSAVISNVAGGGGIGNDTAPAMVGAIGTITFADQGNLFSSSLLFNQGTQVKCQANIGPIYTLVNQPNVSADSGSFTCSQHNALRVQPKWGPNTGGGSIFQTSAELIFLFASVDATVGLAAVGTMSYVACKAPTLTAGGTITTLNCIDMALIPADAGISNIRGINSLLPNGALFINHLGLADSLIGGRVTFFGRSGVAAIFSNDIHVNSNIDLNIGPLGGIGVAFRSSGVGLVRMQGYGGSFNQSLVWDFDHSLTVVRISSTTNGSPWFDTIRFSIGTTTPASANWFFGITAPAQTVTLAGDHAHCLNSSGGLHTINAALSNFFQWIVNAPSGTIGSGSVTNSGIMLLQTSTSIGTNRYGLLITSNPTGGTLNYALRVTVGDSRFDGRVDINNGIALGGGAAPTLGTIGGAGPTVAAQAQWVEIDINGVAHWIPVWV